MKTILRPLAVLLAAAMLAAMVTAADDDAETGPHSGAQAVADALRSFTSADGAFVAGGQIVKGKYDKANLASLLQFPNEDVVVVSLTGSQIRQAFERAVSIYPTQNSSFLQISGFEVKFNKNAPPGSRITEVTAGASKLEDSRTYTVAMPAPLARGGYGYFKIWDKAKITKTFENTTLESILKGKRATDTAPRWSAQP